MAVSVDLEKSLDKAYEDKPLKLARLPFRHDRNY